MRFLQIGYGTYCCKCASFLFSPAILSQDLRSAQLPGGGSANDNVTLNTLSREASIQLLGTGKSLTWDEFQTPDHDEFNSEENSPGGGKTALLPAATQQLLETSLFQNNTTSTAAAASLRDLLDKANLNWGNYLCSPIGMTDFFY